MAQVKNLATNLDYLVEEIRNFILDLRLSPEQTRAAISYVIEQLTENANLDHHTYAVSSEDHLKELIFSDC